MRLIKTRSARVRSAVATGLTVPGLLLSGIGTAVLAPAFTAAAEAATPVASIWTAPASVDRTPVGATPSTAWPVGGRTGANLGQQSWYAVESFALWGGVAAQVNLSTGNFVLNSDDGPGPDRVYNSAATGSGAFGTGAVMVGGRDVGLVASGANRVFHAPSGFTATFTPKTGGGWNPPAGLNADLKQNADSTWALTYRKSAQTLTFTAGGYLVREADRNVNAQTYRYWSDGLLASIQDVAGRVTNFSYTSGRVTQVTEPGGRSTSYGYDPSGQLTTVTDATGAVTTYTWDSGKLAFIQDPRGNYAEIRYDTAGRVESFRRYKYEGLDPRNSAATFFTYGNATSTAGATTRTVVKDARANDSSYDLDSSGRVVKVTDPNGVARSKTWTANSDVATAVDAFGTGQTAAGVTTTYTYDQGTNNLSKVQVPTGAAATAAYAASTTCSTTDTSHPYLAKCTTDGQGNSAAYTYDGPGNLLTAKDTSAGGGAVTKTYTYQGTNGAACGGKPGQMCSATDGRGNTTRYAYDSDGNLKTVTHPTVSTGTQLGTVTYTYDQLGRLIAVKDGKGQTTSYAYDARDRTTQVTYSGAGGKTVYAFDGNSNPTAQHDISSTGVVSTSNFTYDTLNRQTFKQLPGQAAPEQVEYDEAGNVTDYTDPTGFRTRYIYDPANQLTSIGNGAGCSTDPLKCTTMSYEQGRLKTVTYPGNTVQTYGYDGAGRVIGIKAVNGGGTTLTDYAYTYAKGGCGDTSTADQGLLRTRLDKVGNGAPANSKTTYCYDTLSRLTSAVEKIGTSSSANASWAYQYDATGNRTRSEVLLNGSTATNTWGYNQVDQLTSRNGSTSGWAYDANGNETASPGAAIVAGVQPRTSVLNARDQVSSITTNGTTAIPMSYLGSGNKERTQAGSTPFVNGALGLATAGSYGYTRTPGGTPIAQRLPDGTSLYYLTDIQGSVVGMVNTAGQKVATYSYDPYGQPRTTAGAAAANNPLRYTGGYLDTNTGLYKLGYRYYDPSTGRFTQRDPSGQEANPYLYAAANPCNRSDPSGLLTVDLGDAITDCIKGGAVDFVLGVFQSGGNLGKAAVDAAVGCVTEVAGNILEENTDGVVSELIGFGFDAKQAVDIVNTGIAIIRETRRINSAV